MSYCNFCAIQEMKKGAAKKGNKIVIRGSNFMGGRCVFEIPKDEELPKYIEPNDKYPNGDAVYKKYNRAWMMAIGKHCEC